MLFKAHPFQIFTVSNELGWPSFFTRDAFKNSVFANDEAASIFKVANYFPSQELDQNKDHFAGTNTQAEPLDSNSQQTKQRPIEKRIKLTTNSSINNRWRHGCWRDLCCLRSIAHCTFSWLGHNCSSKLGSSSHNIIVKLFSLQLSICISKLYIRYDNYNTDDSLYKIIYLNQNLNVHYI